MLSPINNHNVNKNWWANATEQRMCHQLGKGKIKKRKKSKCWFDQNRIHFVGRCLLGVHFGVLNCINQSAIDNQQFFYLFLVVLLVYIADGWRPQYCLNAPRISLRQNNTLYSLATNALPCRVSTIWYLFLFYCQHLNLLWMAVDQTLIIFFSFFISVAVCCCCCSLHSPFDYAILLFSLFG